MTRTLLLAALPLLVAAASSSSSANDLAWLEGRWTGSKDGVDSEEIWTSPTGGALVGVHKDVKAGKMISFEFLRIEPTADGLVYFASPRSRPPTPFTLVEAAPRRAVFANPEHAYPTRIIYWLEKDGALHARIEGKDGESEEWRWTPSPAR